MLRRGELAAAVERLAAAVERLLAAVERLLAAAVMVALETASETVVVEVRATLAA